MTNATLVVLLSLASTGSARADDGLATDAIAGTPAGLAIGPDGDAFVATTLAAGSALTRLDVAGDAIASATFDAAIHDLAVDPESANVAVLLDDALVVLDLALHVQWRIALGSDIAVGQVAIGEHGTLAVVADDTLLTFTAAGQPRLRQSIGFAAAGVAVLDAYDMIVIAGTRRGRVCDRRIDDAALVAFDGSGALRWDAYRAATRGRDCDDAFADTRLVDVTRGADGALYVLGEAEGGTAFFDTSTLVAFDEWTAAPAIPTARVAYYARMSTDGVPLVSQYFGFAAEFSTVRPDAIAADIAGNVYLSGASTHTLADDASDDGEAQGGAVGFYHVVAADFRARTLWRELELDDLEGERVRLAIDGERAIAMVPAVHDDADLGPAVLVLPTTPDAGQPGRRPDRDDVGTFGYESGISGADPTCYCDARNNRPSAISLAAFGLLALARRRTRSASV